MNSFKYILIFLISLIIASCSKKDVKESLIKEKDLELQVLEAYKEGKVSLEHENLMKLKFYIHNQIGPQDQL